MNRGSSIGTQLAETLNGFLGLPCWDVRSGVGSMFYLHFGRRVRKRRASCNPTLSAMQSIFFGERQIAILWEGWSLLDGGAQLATGMSTPSEIQHHLSLLQGGEIVEAQVLLPAQKVCIHFSEDLVLDILLACPEANRDLMTVRSNDHWLTVESTGEEPIEVIEPIERED